LFAVLWARRLLLSLRQGSTGSLRVQLRHLTPELAGLDAIVDDIKGVPTALFIRIELVADPPFSFHDRIRRNRGSP
jgi:hypothetical protein